MLNITIPERTQYQMDSGHEPNDGDVLWSEEHELTNSKGILKEVYMKGYGWIQVFEPNGVSNGSIKDIRTRSNLPRDFINIRWSDFKWSYYGENMQHSNQFRLAQSIITENERYRREGFGVYIQSRTTGNGKTMLACVIANELIERYGITVKFVTQAEYFRMMRSTDQEERKQAKAMRNATILILDDIGASPCSTPWQQETMFNLISERYKEGHLTIYTSNLPPDELELDKGGRCFDRLIGKTIGLQLPDVPIRRNKAIEDRKKMEADFFGAKKNI